MGTRDGEKSLITQIGPICVGPYVRAPFPAAEYQRGTLGAEEWSETIYVAGFEDEGKGPQAKMCG